MAENKTEKGKSSKTSSLAIWSFCLGLWWIISIIIPSFSIGLAELIVNIVGIGLGISALVSISKDKRLKGKWLAIAGIVLNSAYIIIIAVSFMSFGALSPDEFVPEKCTLPSGVACLDFTGDLNTVTLVIVNSAGFDMQNIVLTIHTTETDLTCTDSESDATLADSETDTFTCLPSQVLNPGILKGTISMSYVNSQTETQHTTAGELVLKV